MSVEDSQKIGVISHLFPGRAKQIIQHPVDPEGIKILSVYLNEAEVEKLAKYKVGREYIFPSDMSEPPNTPWLHDRDKFGDFCHFTIDCD